jgi:hypothetical protein
MVASSMRAFAPRGVADSEDAPREDERQDDAGGDGLVFGVLERPCASADTGRVSDDAEAEE